MEVIFCNILHLLGLGYGLSVGRLVYWIRSIRAIESIIGSRADYFTLDVVSSG